MHAIYAEGMDGDRIASGRSERGWTGHVDEVSLRWAWAGYFQQYHEWESRYDVHALVMGREGGVLGGPISMTSFGNCFVVRLGQWWLCAKRNPHKNKNVVCFAAMLCLENDVC